MSRRRFTVAVLGLFVLGSVLATPIAVVAQNGDGPSTGDLALKDLLEKVLRARRPEEFAFIARVIELVDEGTLPRSLVVSTFQWARNKPRHPFQYFEQALRLRAAQLGIEL